jgi:acylphosphatase
MKSIQAHIIYTGHVQGVGFRYTTVDYARRHGVKGTVRNLPTGQVEIIAEAAEEKIEHLCADLEDQFGSFIRDKRIALKPADVPQYNSFEVIF